MLFDICLTEILFNFDHSNNNFNNNILNISNNNLPRIFDSSNILYLYLPLNSQNNNLNDISSTNNRETIYNNFDIYNDFNHRSYTNLLEESFNENPKFKKVATKEIIDNLKKECFSLENKNFKNTSCPIYYVDFEENEEITILPCSHCFNNNAIKKWLSEENNECPVCRFELSYNEIKIINDRELDSNSYIDSNLYPILENNNDPPTEIQSGTSPYRTLENISRINYFNNLQNIINRVYSRSYNIRNNLEDYVSNDTHDNDTEENTNTFHSDQQRNINNSRNLYLSRLRSNFYRQIQNIYEQDIYNRDLEEAISRSLSEQ